MIVVSFLELLGVSGTTGLLTVPSSVAMEPVAVVPEVVVDERFWSKPQVCGHWVQKLGTFALPVEWLPGNGSVRSFGILRIDPAVFWVSTAGMYYAGDVVVCIDHYEETSLSRWRDWTWTGQGGGGCEDEKCRCRLSLPRHTINLLALTEKSIKLSSREAVVVYPYKNCERCGTDVNAGCSYSYVAFYHSGEFGEFPHGVFLCDNCRRELSK